MYNRYTCPLQFCRYLTLKLLIQENQLQEIMGWESSDVVRFDLGPLRQGQMRRAKLKSAYNLLISDPRGLQCETNLQEIMGWESSDAIIFDLEPLVQGQTRTAKLKSADNSLIIDPRGLQCKTN